MSRRVPPRHRRIRGSESAWHLLLAELGWFDLSWPIVGWSAVVLALGFGPLLLISLIEATGVTRQLLAALGPVLVCLAFAALVWRYGMRTAAATGRSKRSIGLLTALFVALAGLVGWALFVSV